MHPEIFGNAVKLSRKKYPKMNHKVSNIKTLFLLKMDGLEYKHQL